MERILLFIFLLLLALNIKAQGILDSIFIISTKKIPLRSLTTNKVIYYIKPGDTINLLNIRIKPNYYISVNDKNGIVSAVSLDSAINVKAAVEYETNKINKYEKLAKIYGKKWATAIVYGDIEIGMPENVVVAIKGRPTKINRSTYSFGVHQQWVYENKYFPEWTEYYYFENGKLTSWQDH